MSMAWVAVSGPPEPLLSKSSTIICKMSVPLNSKTERYVSPSSADVADRALAKNDTELVPLPVKPVMPAWFEIFSVPLATDNVTSIRSVKASTSLMVIAFKGALKIRSVSSSTVCGGTLAPLNERLWSIFL